MSLRSLLIEPWKWNPIPRLSPFDTDSRALHLPGGLYVLASESPVSIIVSASRKDLTLPTEADEARILACFKEEVRGHFLRDSQQYLREMVGLPNKVPTLKWHLYLDTTATAN